MEEKSTEELQTCIDTLRSWIITQPHLPQDLDDILVLRFAHSCYYDLDQAKKTIETFNSVRMSALDLITNRDPQSATVQKYLKIVNLAQIKISGSRNLWIWQLNDPGLEHYDYIQDAKLFFMTTDAFLLSDDVLEESDIVVMDVKDISLKFLTKFNMSAAKKLSKYQEDAMPIRLKQVHVVNAPSSIDKIYGLMKPFLQKRITDMIYFHPPKSESLYKYISKEDLPSDYGGVLESMDEQSVSVVELINRHRDQLINEHLWRGSSSKSDKKSKSKNETPPPEMKFRNLSID